MDQPQAPVLEALAAFHANPPTTCTPPGYQQGRGTDACVHVPGIPAALPGERLDQDVIDYPRTGLDAGMPIPDRADPRPDSVRVAVET
ncbi:MULTISPECIES: hypothetical protein [Kitasatospora]|uniref:Uncharacterized protein n=1 Tax=Kitasatospora setae (strain ATCC 33774 / DSM 43861 / JCM 3304 / KCC A-0304 / NBRC 14216 / KM-6054) TaxID=452652 RepID=E4NA42_KITSK|nr:hypothetical protein KSE_22530 [Kitasatospora setae KM-6054]